MENKSTTANMLGLQLFVFLFFLIPPWANQKPECVQWEQARRQCCTWDSELGHCFYVNLCDWARQFCDVGDLSLQVEQMFSNLLYGSFVK